MQNRNSRIAFGSVINTKKTGFTSRAAEKKTRRFQKETGAGIEPRACEVSSSRLFATHYIAVAAHPARANDLFNLCTEYTRTEIVRLSSIPTLNTVVHNCRIPFASQYRASCNKIVVFCYTCVLNTFMCFSVFSLFLLLYYIFYWISVAV